VTAAGPLRWGLTRPYVRCGRRQRRRRLGCAPAATARVCWCCSAMRGDAPGRARGGSLQVNLRGCAPGAPGAAGPGGPPGGPGPSGGGGGGNSGPSGALELSDMRGDAPGRARGGSLKVSLRGCAPGPPGAAGPPGPPGGPGPSGGGGGGSTPSNNGGKTGGGGGGGDSGNGGGQSNGNGALMLLDMLRSCALHSTTWRGFAVPTVKFEVK